MRKIGYASVSSAAQNLDRQLGALRAEQCDQIFAEKMSGKSLKGRPQLEKAIDALGTGDVLVVAEWDRATRSMMDGIAIIDRVLARGALVRVLDKAHLDLTSTIGKGLLAFLSAIAQDERERIAKRANEGRATAKAQGRRFGRKPRLASASCWRGELPRHRQELPSKPHDDQQVGGRVARGGAWPQSLIGSFRSEPAEKSIPYGSCAVCWLQAGDGITRLKAPSTSSRDVPSASISVGVPVKPL
jgi:DNA invertase Pin-like site-specific DNA recombinase